MTTTATAGSTPRELGTPLGAELYAALAKPFDATFHDVRGGVELEYITGEQCVSRLNDTLGVGGWSFEIKEHGFNTEADELWVLGHLEGRMPFLDAYGAPVVVVREQFGSQKLKRSRSSGQPLDIGFDYKGATTDALKKCASLMGVGLWLSRKEATPAAGGQQVARTANRDDRPHAARPEPDGAATGRYTCEDCGAELKETRFKDGTVWGPGQLASFGQRKHGKVLCMDHYRTANELRKTQMLTS